MTTTPTQSRSRVPTDLRFAATVVDVATGKPCDWALARTPAGDGWRVVPASEKAPLPLGELEDLFDAIDQMSVCGYFREHYPGGLVVRLAGHEAEDDR